MGHSFRTRNDIGSQNLRILSDLPHVFDRWFVQTNSSQIDLVGYPQKLWLMHDRPDLYGRNRHRVLHYTINELRDGV